MKTLTKRTGACTIRLQLWTATGNGTGTQYETHDVASADPGGTHERVVSVSLTTPLAMAAGQIYVVGAWETDGAGFTEQFPGSYVNATPNANFGNTLYGLGLPMLGGLILHSMWLQTGNSATVPPYGSAATAFSGGTSYPVMPIVQ
jgi:hypothetical protein